MSADSPQKKSDSQIGKTPFEEFLLAEYDNIAHAHFNTIESLSNFIKHYIVIASIPFAVAAIFLDAENLKTVGTSLSVQNHSCVIAGAMTILSLIGFSVLGYVINIRFDAILYARTVNGIRKHFYDKSGVPLEEELRIRALLELPRFRGRVVS